MMREEMFGRRETYGLWYELFCMALKGMNMNLSGGGIFERRTVFT